VKVKTDSGTENTKQVIAEISCITEPYLVGGPGLINIDDLGCTLVEVVNTGPEPIMLNRGQEVGQADNAEGQSLFPFQANVVNKIAEQQWKDKHKPATNVRPDFFKMCNLEVPSEYKDKYRTLLTKHKDIFSLSKSDLGFCDTVLHKLFMKTRTCLRQTVQNSGSAPVLSSRSSSRMVEIGNFSFKRKTGLTGLYKISDL
jgi:hypothetical protein